MKGKPREKKVKAAAIAALILGDSPTEVADRYELPRGTVRNWQPAAKKLAEVSRISGTRIADLVDDYLETGLKTLIAQAHQASDPEWLRKQSAKDLAALFGGTADRTFLLLDMVKL